VKTTSFEAHNAIRLLRSIVAADGMAGVTVAASFDINRGLEIDAVEACELETHGRAVSVPAEALSAGADGVRVLAKLGRPLPRWQVHIVGDQGACVPFANAVVVFAAAADAASPCHTPPRPAMACCTDWPADSNACVTPPSICVGSRSPNCPEPNVPSASVTG
jgi:hypothetical protein